MLGRSLLHAPQGVIQEAGHDDATKERPGEQHVLPKCVRVQLFKDTFSIRAPSLSHLFLPTLEKLSGGHLLFLPPP